MKRFITLSALALVIVAGAFHWGCSKKSNPTEPPVAPIPYTVYEGSGVVGDQGGRVQVTDSASPIVGAFVEIPAGALTSNQTISIAKAPDGVYAPTDSSAIVVKLEPSGVIFNKPVIVGLPFKAAKADPADIQAYCLNADSMILSELAVDSVDVTNKTAITVVSHFSLYYSSNLLASNTRMYIEMLNIGGTIGAKLRATRFDATGYDKGFYYIPANIAFTVGYILENNYTANSIFQVKLKEHVPWGIDKEITSRRYYFTRYSSSTSGAQNIALYKYNNQTHSFLTPLIHDQSNREMWFSGKPLVTRFDGAIVDPSKKYYIEVEWCLSSDLLGNYLSRYTWLHVFNNSKDKMKPSEMTSFNKDANNNFVEDSYETSTTNSPPLAPSNPTPANNDTNKATSLTLSWSCSDLENDPLTYDVYFGTANPPTTKVSSNQSVNKLSRDWLSAGTAYYWYVKARDSRGNTSTGEVWKFTTGTAANSAPAAPYSPSPAANATGQQTSISLTWACSDPENDPLFYDVYFSTANPPTTLVSQNQRTTSLYRSGLLNSKDYYWKIVAKDDHNNNTPGPVWKFTTAASTTPNNPPASPSGPSPADGAANVATSITLSWSCSDPDGDALTYDVYFGKVSPPTILVSQNQTATTLARSGLDLTTGYYWRVVAKDNKGGVTNSPQWRFATTIGGTAPNAPVLASPANTATGVSIYPTLSWSDASGATSFTLQVSQTNTFTTFVYNQSGLTNLSQAVSGLDALTTYYWRVRGTNEYGTSPWSSVWSFTTGNVGQLIFYDDFNQAALNTDMWSITQQVGGATYIVENGNLKLLANNSGVHWITIKSIQQFTPPILIEYRISVPGSHNWLNSGIDSTGPNISSGNENHDSRTIRFRDTVLPDIFPNAVDSIYHTIQIDWVNDSLVIFKDLTTGLTKQIIDATGTCGSRAYFQAGDVYTKNNRMFIDYIKIYQY